MTNVLEMLKKVITYKFTIFCSCQFKKNANFNKADAQKVMKFGCNFTETNTDNGIVVNVTCYKLR